MSCGGEDRRWVCGKAGVVNIQRMGSIVRDISEPCIPRPSLKAVVPINKMLKPDKWEAAFDSDGKALGFRKALKLIIFGGVDPSIRTEVWEFLLGCYALSSTALHRRELRAARRAHYEDLIKQCQKLHASIGTGSLAYIVGSKVMDMRTSKDEGRREVGNETRKASINIVNYAEDFCSRSNNCTDKSYTCQPESSNDSTDIVSFRESADSAAYDSSCCEHTSGICNCSSLKLDGGVDGSQFVAESYFDFPPLPVTNLFDKRFEDGKEYHVHDTKISAQHELRFEDESMHSFHINNNIDLINESKGSSSSNVLHPMNSEIEMVRLDESDLQAQSRKKADIVNRLRISDVPVGDFLNGTTSLHGGISEEKVSEWLWTLHQIVVDVVRTDSHLEFYGDPRNLARMSDILAVYAWVDPATGYCQGMSDLLSPFVVLFDDNADAFWCFEMLLRRMRENFQMEGPAGVMKQLQALSHILELTDREMFSHLSHIGAESLHFAFRMLLVLFRRELSFNETLFMWEMIWAADFDESMASSLETNCLEGLVIQLPTKEKKENDNGSMKVVQLISGNMEHSMCDNNGTKSGLAHPLCGLTRNLWSKDDHVNMCTAVSSTKKRDEELPVFCVAAILILNRQKIIRETRSIDDMIKIFNDKMLKINVRRCIHAAIKLRKKYLYKVRFTFGNLILSWVIFKREEFYAAGSDQLLP